MAKTYIYGGYIVTGGNLDNGSPWQGVRVLLAETSAERPTPMTAISANGLIKITQKRFKVITLQEHSYKINHC